MTFAKVRRSLFVVHMWIGIGLGVLLALLGLSGSVLVYDDVIANLLAPPPAAQAQGKPLSLDAIIAVAREEGGRGPATIMPATAGEAAMVRIGTAGRGAGGPGNRGTQIYVDPVSGKVLGKGAATLPPLLAVAHQLHGNFLMGRSGRSFVGWLGVAMLLLGVSGLVLWWPKRGQWKFAFIVRRNAKGLRFHRELHGMVGIWAFVVFMIVSFSGVVLAWPEAMRGLNGGGAAPAISLRDGPAVEPGQGARIGADQAAALALKTVPEASLRSITLPARKTQAISVGLERGGANVTLWLDPYRGTVMAANDPMAGSDVMAWQRPLHQGAALGWLWRMLVCLSGFLPSLFVITGIAMWVKKRRHRIAMSAPLAAQAAE